MKAKRLLRVVAIIASIVCILAVGFMLRFPPGPRPWCHKQFDSALIQWMMADGQTNWKHGAGIYPNAEGKETESIALFGAYVKGAERIPEDYGYVPGLHESDPSDLVLMYVKRKTRHKWHGDHTPTIFTEPKWMVIAPGFLYEDSHLTGTEDLIRNPEYCAEGGRLELTSVFRERLRKTLDFLKENNRPFWTNVVQEHSEFIDSIEE